MDANLQRFNYTINNTPLKPSKIIKDLGVLFDDKLSFKNHIVSIISRASKILGFIFRSLKPFSKIETHLILYYAYIRNILEYGLQIWNPYYNIHTNAIENVQRKFTRMICYKFGIPRGTYQSRLENLKMVSLFHRRLFTDELFLYKILSLKISTKLIDCSNIHVPNRQTRFAPIFYLPAVISNVEFYSCALRLKRQHNEYFSTIDSFEDSIALTKKKISQALPVETWGGFR